MAGKGFAPKSKDNMRVVEIAPTAQPPLPEWHDWHQATRDWWAMWGEFPLASDFSASDWAFLIDTALLQDAFYRGETKHAGELRLRVAKFGQTVEDRARLRITFATADAAEHKAAPRAVRPRRERRGVLIEMPHAAGE